MKIFAKTILIVSSVIFLSFIIKTFLNMPSENIYLYLACQNIKTGHLEILFFDQNNNQFDQQKFQLNTACKKQIGIIVVEGVAINSLSVTMHLYSAQGKVLFTKQGSYKKNDILLDKNGFHVDLVLNSKPPHIAFHSL